jgi:hypothetical protein
MTFCSLTEPDGTRRASSMCPTTSRRSSCLPARPELNPPGRERLAVSPPELALKHRPRKTTTRSSTSHAPLGESSSLNPKRSCHRNARLGSRRSAAMTLSIICPALARLPHRESSGSRHAVMMAPKTEDWQAEQAWRRRDATSLGNFKQ